jgi:polyisoprenoid-binding protein YceI
MRILGSVALAAVLCLPSTAARSDAAASAGALDIASGTYALDKTHASITWRVMHMGLSNYTARFARFDATVSLDAAAVANSTVTVTIDPLSVRTDYSGEEDFDGKISKDARMLNAGKFPEIKFVSREVRVTGPKRLSVVGDLAMAGVTKPMTLDATIVGTLKSHPFVKQPAFGISAKGELKRTDFGVAYPPPGGVSDRVEILVEAEFIRKP